MLLLNLRNLDQTWDMMTHMYSQTFTPPTHEIHFHPCIHLVNSSPFGLFPLMSLLKVD